MDCLSWPGCRVLEAGERAAVANTTNIITHTLDSHEQGLAIDARADLDHNTNGKSARGRLQKFAIRSNHSRLSIPAAARERKLHFVLDT